MKPIIIYQDKSNNKISLTKKEFEDYIQQAFSEGYNAGYTFAASVYNKPTITTPNYPYWYNTSTGDPVPNHTEITCTGTDASWLTHPTITAAEAPPCTLTTANTTEKLDIKYKENHK